MTTALVPPSFSREYAEVKSGLQAIGYKRGLLRPGYTFTDFLAPTSVTRQVTLAAFAQEPPSFVNACFGVVIGSSDPTEAVTQCLALGAPQVLVLRSGNVDRWSPKLEGGPRYLERIPTAAVRDVFEAKRAEWRPDAVFRAKSPLGDARPQQLDFIDLGLLPALERQAQAKLDGLIVGVLREAKRVFERQHRDTRFPENEFFRALFGLVRAKVLRDSGAVSGIDLSDPCDALRRVAAFYPRDATASAGYLDEPEVLSIVADRVARTFLLDNLSPETLAYVYENTLVTPEQRRELGIHSTPPYIADYILSRLPVEEMTLESRNVLDPMCGRGTLLVAALRRLKDLLPASLSFEQKHRYFVEHIRGTDLKPYTCEVAKLSLLLADLPNPNGWQINAEDMFIPGRLEKAVSQASIIIGNPPFEAFKPEQSELYAAETRYKGGEMLRRVLPALRGGGMVGVVMPKKLLEGRSYEQARRELSSGFEIIEITSLPDSVFPHSDAETVLLMARKLRGRQTASRDVLFRRVRKADRAQFQAAYRATWEERIPREKFRPTVAGEVPTFQVPELMSLWDRLSEGPRLGDVAEVHRGVEYADRLMSTERDALIRPMPFDGAARGLASAGKQLSPLSPYAIGAPVYLETDPRRRRGGAWRRPWDQPKVVTNANRASRGPWRLVAATDHSGLVCTQTFHGIWARDASASLDVLAAVLNGPLANAFVYAHEPAQDNRNETLERIPFPLNWRSLSARVSALVTAYTAAASEGLDQDAASILLQIDAEVLQAYALPPREERKLLDLFWGEDRPGVASFNGYIPPDFTAWIPLHMYLSERFQRSTCEAIRTRGPRIVDPDVLNFFERIS